MNKEEIEKALRLFDRQDLIDDVIEDLDTNIGIFMTVNQMIYYSKLQQENKRLKDNWNEIKKELLHLRDLTFTKEFGNEWVGCLSFNDDILPILKKMQELEGDNND